MPDPTTGIPVDHPDAAQIVPDETSAPAAPVELPKIFQPEEAPAAGSSIPVDSAEASKIVPDAAPTPAHSEAPIPVDSVAGQEVEPYSSYLKKLPRNLIAQTYLADRAEAKAKGAPEPDKTEYKDAYAARAAEGNLFGDKDLRPDAPEGPGLIKTGYEIASSLVVGFGTHLNSISKTVFGADIKARWTGNTPAPDMTSAERGKAAATLASGQELAFLQGANMLRQASINIANAYTRGIGLPEERKAYDDQFEADLSINRAVARVSEGKTAFSRPGAFGILSDNHEVDKEELQKIASSPLADPTAAAGMIVGLAGKGAQAAEAIQRAQTIITAGTDIEKASLAARTVAKTAETVSSVLKKGGSVVQNTPNIIKRPLIVGATHALGGGTALEVVLGLGAGESRAVSMLDKATGLLDNAATSLRKPVPAGPVGKFSASLYGALTDEAKSAAVSQAFNLPFALGAESREDAEHAILTGFIAHGAMRTVARGAHFANSLSPITNFWHEASRSSAERTPVRDYGTDVGLDAMHQDVVKIANNEGNNLIAAARGLLTKTGQNGEVYLGRPEHIVSSLVNMADRGVTFFDPETNKQINMTPENAKFISEQAGATVKVVLPPDAPGQPPKIKHVAIVPFSEGAPAVSIGHELYHVVESTMSKQEQNYFHQETMRVYGPEGIENARQHYAQMLGVDPTTISDNRVTSEIMSENFSGRLNSTPVGAFGPGGEMTFKNPAYRKYVRETAAFTEKMLQKLGGDVPETAVPITVKDSQGREYVRMVPGGKNGIKGGLGWEQSSQLGALIDNFLESKYLDKGVAESQGHPDPFTEVQHAATEDNPIQNVREVAPEPGFKKGDPIGEVSDSSGNVVAKEAVVTKVIADKDGNHQYEIEYVDPKDGKRKVGTVPEEFLRSPEAEEGTTATPKTPEKPATVDVGVLNPVPADLTQPSFPGGKPAANTTTTPAKPAANTAPRPNARGVTPAERAHLGTEPTSATPEVLTHNLGTIEHTVSQAAKDQPLLQTDYYSASEGRESDTGPVREERRKLVAAAPAADTAKLSQNYDKLVHIYKYEPNPKNGRPFVTAFSFDNFIANAKMVDSWLRQNGQANHPAIQRIQSAGFPEAVQNYWRNQANGYRGDGQPLVRPGDLKPGTVEPQNPNFKPVKVAQSDVQIINMLMGIELPRNSSVASRFAAKMARENGLSPTENAAGVEITNPLTADLVQKGFDPNLLHSTVQQLSVDKLTSKLTPSALTGTSRANLATVRAGFMPKAEEAIATNYANRNETFGGRLISADLVRTEVNGYNKNDPGATHETASSISNELLQRALVNPAIEDVTFMGGPAGAGKTTVARGMLEGQASRVIFDSTLGGARGAQRVRQAIEAGKNVDVHFVYAPFETTVDRIVGRFHEEGRTVPAKSIVENYRGSIQNFLTLHEAFPDSPLVQFRATDNSGGTPRALDNSVEFLYNALHDLPSDRTLTQQLRNRPEIPSEAQDSRGVPSLRGRGPEAGRGSPEGGSLAQAGGFEPTPTLRGLEVPYSAKDDGNFVVKPRYAEPAKKRTGLFSTLEGGESKYMPKAVERDIKDSLDKPGWAIVTATKESDGPATGAKNISANEALRAQLEASGHDVTEVGGSYKGVDQGKSFLVRGISEPEALKLAQEHGQESILTHRGLVYQDGSAHAMDASKTKYGAEALKQDAYTTLPDGTAFAADINFDRKVPNDLGRYKEIHAEMRAMIKEGKAGSPEFNKLWQENEDIKNRQPDAGMPPKGAYMPKKAAPLEHSVSDKELSLVHYGNAGMKELDPAKFGKSGLTPRSELAGRPRVYFYEKGRENASDPVVGRGAKYETTVDGGKIYDGDKDKLNYGSIVNREKADNMLRDAGYVGIRRTRGTKKDGYSQVELFDKTKVKPLLSEAQKAVPKPGTAAWTKWLNDGADPQYMPKASAAQESALKDSKVRGPDGKLLPLFHGTYSEFKKFKQGDLGYHFGTEDAANARIGDAIKTGEVPAAKAFDAFPELRDNLPPGVRPSLEAMADGARTIPTFLDIKNPLLMDDVGPWNDAGTVWNHLPKTIQRKLPAVATEVSKMQSKLDGYDGPTRGYDAFAEKQYKPVLTSIREGLKSLGYDGVVYQNEHEAAGSKSYIAFDGKQIVPAYAHDAKARFMPKAVSTVPLFDGSEPKPDISPLAFEIGKGLADRSRKMKRIPHESRAPEAKDAISDTVVDEISYALTQRDNALGWYEAMVMKAMDKFAEIHPELKTDPDRGSLFKILLAITSNGQKVAENAHRADAIYQGWKDTGRIDSTSNWGGARKNQINKGLEMLQQLVDEKGLNATAEFLNKKFTVGELKKMGFGISGEAVSHTVRGAAIFGPKVGAGFYANLQGDFSPVTMDLWLMRTWNRINGSYGVSDTAGMSRAIVDLRKATVENPNTPEAAAISQMSDRALGNWAEKRLTEWTKKGFKDPTPFDRPAKRFSESKDGAVEGPRNGNERAWVREVFAEVDKKLAAAGLPEINNADKQALLWYYEKDLYSQFGYRKRAASAQDYATAAAEVVERRKSNAKQ